MMWSFSMITVLLFLIIFNLITANIIPNIEETNNDLNNSVDNSLTPLSNDNLIFDLDTIPEDEFNLLIKSTPDEDNKTLQDLSESSGDFSPIFEPKSKASSISIHRLNEKNHCFDGKCEQDVWIQYKYEKAYKLINKTVTRSEAQEMCSSYNAHRDTGATLAVPLSHEEQDFINKYLFEVLKLVKNVWIGQNTENYAYSGTGGQQWLYQNWGKGMPTLTKACVQIRSPFSVFGHIDNNFGAKWEDVSCFRKNLVLCEKPQEMNENQLIRIVKELRDEIDDIKHQAIPSVPKGFVYTQLPKHLTPKELWPGYKWTDISHLYGSLFFRVVGRDSAPYGQIQAPNAPHLSGVKSYGIHGVPIEELRTEVVGADNKWSNINFNGFPVGFRVSAGEVRPINTAIKLWIRE